MAEGPVQPTEAGSASETGKVRDHNEDACRVDVERGLFVVSDGMGGEQAGELASEITIEVLPRLIDRRIARPGGASASAVRQAMRDAVVELSGQIRSQTAARPDLKGMGATVVLALIRGRCAHITHMGDSRAYLFRDGKLSRLTEDHSVVGILLRHGEITPAQAKAHPAKGRLSRYVGMEGDVYPDTRTVTLEAGDRLLLCTDGLTGMVADDRIEAVLGADPDPQQACQSLVDAANQAGGKDNITTIVVNCT